MELRRIEFIVRTRPGRWQQHSLRLRMSNPALMCARLGMVTGFGLGSVIRSRQGFVPLQHRSGWYDIIGPELKVLFCGSTQCCIPHQRNVTSRVQVTDSGRLCIWPVSQRGCWRRTKATNSLAGCGITSLVRRATATGREVAAGLLF
jgi:hypothetical protein